MENTLLKKIEEGNVVTLDIETNDSDKKTCEILQISLYRMDGRGGTESYSTYIKPVNKYEIAEGAFEKHGLTKEFIEENGNFLKDVAQGIIDFIGDRDLLVYNGMSFDIPILCRQFKEVGFDFPFNNRKIYDSYLFECALNSHKLEEVYFRMFGEYPQKAHDALDDCISTMKVFQKQLEQIDNYDEYTQEKDIKTEMVFPEGFVKFNENNNLVFAVGKYQNQDVFDIYNSDPQYIKWMWNKEGLLFESTKKYIAAYCKMKKSLQ